MSGSNSSGTASFKVVLLGEGRVGKTCLFMRYIRNTFANDQESTTQATFLEKRLNVGRKSVRLMIWDTAGQERFHALGPIYYRDANGALLVYDITDRDSFTKVRNWVKELRKIVGKNISLVIAGNKSDMEKQRQVDEAEAEAYAESVGAKHILCSAKTGKNVDAAFLEITKGMLAGSSDEGPSMASPTSSSRAAIPITDLEPQPQNSSCCK